MHREHDQKRKKKQRLKIGTEINEIENRETRKNSTAKAFLVGKMSIINNFLVTSDGVLEYR